MEYLKNENKKIEDEMIKLLEEEEGLKGTIVALEKEAEDFIDKRTVEINPFPPVKDRQVSRHAGRADLYPR